MEEWRPIVGYEEFFLISSEGNLFSKRTNKILKQNKVSGGYLAHITKIKGKNVVLKIHREVAKAFIICDYVGLVVNHKDGVKTNNNLNNLEWVTHKQNTQHALDNELKVNLTLVNKGLLSQKLSKEDCEYICSVFKLKDKEYGARALGRKYNVNHETIINIVSRNK